MLVTDNLQVITQEMFFEMIEDRIVKAKMSYVDAIVDICEKKNIDIESIPKLIDAKLRKILKNEALNLNMIKRSGRKLPI